MATMVERMLELSEKLIDDRPRSAAFRRRAVSTSYYALFHQICKICADEIASDHPRSSEEYVRVYRFLDHGLVKAFFQNSRLNENERIRKIGESFVQLQNSRIRVDYWPPIKSEFPVAEVRDLIAAARGAVIELGSLAAPDRQALVVHLLVKEKSR